MRKAYLTIITIITAICILIGSYRNLVHRGGAHYEQEEYEEHNEVYPPAEEHTYRIEEDITGIDIDIEAGNVYIWNDPVNAIDVNDPAYFEFEVDQGILKIVQSQDYKKLINHEADGEDFLPDITIYLADDMQIKTLDAEIEAGSFYMSGEKSYDEAEIDCEMGDIQVDNVYFRKAEIKCKMGNISLNSIRFEDLKVEEELGNIDIFSSEDLSDYEKDLSVKLGNLSMNGASIGRSIKTSGSDGKLTVSNKMGDVSVNW